MASGAGHGPARLDGLQAGRAVAAIAVAAYHANGFVLPLRLSSGEEAWRGFGMGYAGVEFFFVLSGFLMVHVHARDFGAPRRLGAFLRKRAVRIYPAYWVVLGGLMGLYLALPPLAPEVARDPAAVASGFLLLPTGERTILPVAWTLTHEVFFYLLFGACILRRRLGGWLLALWGGACAAALLLPAQSFPASFVLSPYNLLFVAGMLVGLGGGVAAPARARVLATLGVGGFLAVGLSEAYLFAWDLRLRTLAYGAAAAALVFALSQPGWRVPRGLVLLGDASYAIYLVHLPVSNAVALAMVGFGIDATVPAGTAFVLLVAASCAAGVAFHLLAEKPIIRRLQHGRPPTEPRREIA